MMASVMRSTRLYSVGSRRSGGESVQRVASTPTSVGQPAPYVEARRGQPAVRHLDEAYILGCAAHRLDPDDEGARPLVSQAAQRAASRLV